jgi:UDP-arabinose 4-epimerase
MDLRQAVLVTGGAGYIGAHCCKALCEAGYLPVCYDNLSSGHEAFVKWGPLVVGDIADSQKLADTIAAHGVVAVMHFAAFSLVGESVVDPQKYYQNNLAGTLGLLQAMRETNVLKLVFSSTGAVYGQADNKPIAEAAAGRPINPYGTSKWMIEQVLGDYRRAYGMNSFSLRYFNACGADASCSIGELRNPETHLIPRALMALQGHVSDFAVFGDDYETPDGTALRDYIHVNDLAAAHIAALKLLLAGHEGAALNLGTGNGYSVRQILDAVLAETGRGVPYAMNARRAGDPATLVADPSASKSVLNFEPRHSSLAEVVRSAWAWHQKAHPRAS